MGNKCNHAGLLRQKVPRCSPSVSDTFKGTLCWDELMKLFSSL